MSKLLGNRNVREKYAFGRDLSTRIISLLPHVMVGRAGRGKRRLIKEEDLEQLIARAAEEGVDLWQLVRTHTPESLKCWLTKGVE